MRNVVNNINKFMDYYDIPRQLRSVPCSMSMDCQRNPYVDYAGADLNPLRLVA